MAQNKVNLSFIEYRTSQSHVYLENLTITICNYFSTSITGYNKILIYQPQCYMIYGEINDQMFNTDF